MTAAHPYSPSLRPSGTLLALVLLLVLNVLLTPNFMAWTTLTVNLTQVAPTVIVAIGMALVIATGGIDLSVGSVMALAGALVAWCAPHGLMLALGLSLAAALACGLLNGCLVTRWQVQPIVATLVLFMGARGLANVLTDGQLQLVEDPFLRSLGRGLWLFLPMPVWVMVLVVFVASLVMRFGAYGRLLLAVGGNARAARLSGIGSTRVLLGAYGACALLSALASYLVVGLNASSDANQIGQNMELDSIAAVAVGGSSLSGGKLGVGGTVLGALLIQLIRSTLLAWGVPDAAALVLKAALIVSAVAWQMRGAR